jgi:hypothetical protein
MTIRDEILAYLAWKHEATTADVEAVVIAGRLAVSHELRRLSLAGTVSKTVTRQFETGILLARWSLPKKRAEKL